MVEDALRESSTRGSGTESLGETKGLTDGQVSFHEHERSTYNGLFRDNDTSSLGETLVDTTNSILRGLNFTEEDGFLELRGSGELRSVEDSSGGRDDLTTTSMDSISMESNIMDVESNTSHVLFSQNTFFGGPLEGSFHGVLNFVKVLDGLGDINEHVGAVGLGTEAPDLDGIIGIPRVLIDQLLLSLLSILLRGDLLILDILREFITERGSGTEDSVMLVRGLGKTLLGRFLSDSFLVRDDGVTLLDWALGVLLLKILKADLNVEFTATGDNVLTRFFSVAKN
mmetsp:Transcript_1469/g.1762  ORF Transcript_1469/g.1762 Transcript_1469/m.1762 type:complete len:284 (+) Transcript_1469:187-1038(+)